MRTSASQFQLLVDFMQRYGDLSKPGEGPQGRVTNTKRWAQLTQLLNADGTGDTKTAEKWRKEEVTEPPAETNDSISFNIIEQINEQDASTTVEDWNRPGTSAHPTVFPPDRSQNEPRQISSPAVVPDLLVQEETGHPVVDRSETGLTGGGVPPTARIPLHPYSPRRREHQSLTPMPPTPRRRRRARLQDPSSPVQRRTRTQTQSDLARQAFVRSDCEWWAFQQETERERNRLRQVELTMQERWLDLFGQFLLLGNRIVDILEKKNRA